MEVEYSKMELELIIGSVRTAEYSDDLPIHNWARAAKVLELVAAERRELLRRCNEFLKHAPEFPYRLIAEYDIEDLQSELAKELGDG